MRWLAISAPLILAALAGCDLTGQYDKKFHEALGAAAKRAVFDLVHPTFTDALDPAKAGVGVKLRLPIVFDSNSKTGAKLTGPFAAMAPGPMYVLQRDLDDNQGKWAPCIVAVMAVPKGDQKGDITKSLPAAPGATWTDVSVPTPAGQTATLKRMRIDMSQLAAQLPDAAKAAL